MTDKSTIDAKTISAPEKKPYEKPVLTRLGALRDLTMTLVSKGSPDGKSKRFTGRGGRYLIEDLKP